MNIKLLKTIILILSTTMLYSERKTSILPILSQQSGANKNQVQLELNSEYERVLQEYEKLINKYPEKDELLYNLGNLNYLSGDPESALRNYQNSLTIEDPIKRAFSLYNMGNIYYDKSDFQKSVNLFKEALQLAPDDEDIRHNFELSKLMLQQQPPKQNKEQNQDSNNGQEEQQNKQSQSEEGDEEKQKQGGDEEHAENEDGDQEESTGETDKEEKQSEQFPTKESEGKKEESQNQQPQSKLQEEKEKQLDREEAEAILNSLKANKSNMKKKKYKVTKRVKLEKDW